MIVFKINTNDKFVEFHGDYYHKLLEQVRSVGYLTPSIDEIIITDDFFGEVEKYSNKEFNQPKATREREFKAVAKILDVNGKKKIILDATNVHGLVEATPQIFFEQLLEAYADDFVAQRYEGRVGFNLSTPFTEVIKMFFKPWSTKVVAHAAERHLELKKTFRHDDVRMFVDAFKRKIKKLHYKFQEDLDEPMLYIQAISELDYLVRRCQDVLYDGGSLENVQEFSELPLLLSEIQIQTQALAGGKEIEFSKMRELVLEIFKKCFLNFSIENPQKAKVIDTPKKLFKDLIDTEPRIVAFIDILGFTNIIEDYESDDYSDILRELHEALEKAIEDSINRMTDLQKQSELKEFLQYRMFSDCICISLPYIEYGSDFQNQFNSLALILRSYQIAMMQKGFFVRGGISMGSFYADDNMIFSGALVKAYKLEQKAVNPIIAVDKKVLERLALNFDPDASDLFYDGSLVQEDSNPEIVFLNPFQHIDKMNKYLDYITQDQDAEEQDAVNSILSTVKEMLKKTLEILPSPKQAAIDIKTQILQLIEEKIGELNEAREKELKSESKKAWADKFRTWWRYKVLKHQPPEDKITKILSKYLFLKSFIDWSLQEKRSNEFIFFQLGSNKI